MTKTIAPKSDQMNADDLIGGATKTIKITKVSIVMGEQPVSIHYEGDEGKPYKPGKSMRRVLVSLWGADANLYAGRYLTLYNDDKVTFGGVATGGIRISHMSHIDKQVTLALTTTRSNRKPFTVKPLTIAEEVPVSEFQEEGRIEAAKGVDALKSWWGGLGGSKQKQIGGAVFLEELKKIASKAPEVNALPTIEETISSRAAAMYAEIMAGAEKGDSAAYNALLSDLILVNDSVSIEMLQEALEG
jgi:hypothetical protein